MKVDQIETPYLYLDGADAEYDGSSAIHSNYLQTHVPHAKRLSVPGPYSLPVAELQHALGLLETDEDGLVSLPRSRGRWEHADEFGLQRQELCSGEAHVAALSNGLPGTYAPFRMQHAQVESEGGSLL